MITIRKGTLTLPHKTWLFPGGEVGVKLDDQCLKFFADPQQVLLIARITNSNDVMELVMVHDALKRKGCNWIHLVLPYVPYGRQDRVCNPGEALGVSAFATVIKALHFESVVVFDPHSDVSAAVLNATVIDQVKILGAFDEFNKFLGHFHNVQFVSPDGGSIKKTEKLATYYGHRSYIRASKRRDLLTGEILETEVLDKVENVDLVIIDDICDGGRTFIELAKVLKKWGAASVSLYVTHGIFSKGTKPLYDAGIANIFTTDSFHAVWPDGVSEKVVTLPIDRLL